MGTPAVLLVLVLVTAMARPHLVMVMVHRMARMVHMVHLQDLTATARLPITWGDTDHLQAMAIGEEVRRPVLAIRTRSTRPTNRSAALPAPRAKASRRIDPPAQGAVGTT